MAPDGTRVHQGLHQPLAPDDLRPSIACSIGTSITQWADNKACDLLDVGDLEDIDSGAA